MASYGTITLDGNLSDWGAPLYDDGAGHRLYARYQDGYFIFAAAGASGGVRFFLNSDRNTGTGFQDGGPMGPPISYLPPVNLNPPNPFGTPFAGGAEYQISAESPGALSLRIPFPPPGGAYPYSVEQAWNGDVVEFAIPAAALLGAGDTIDFKAVLSGAYLAQTFVAAPVAHYGSVSLDGGLGDWTASSERSIGNPSYAPPDTRFFAMSTDGALVFAIKTSMLAGTNIFIDSFDWGPGATMLGHVNESLVHLPGGVYTIMSGVDYQIKFDDNGTPALYDKNGDWLNALSFARYGDVTEIVLPHAYIFSASARVMLEFYDGYYGVAYVPPTSIIAAPHGYGRITLDGYIGDWSSESQIPVNTWPIIQHPPNFSSLLPHEPAGSQAFAEIFEGETFLFALKTTPLQQAHILIDADNNAATGATIMGRGGMFGSAPNFVLASGIDYQIGFDAAGNPSLYSSDGATLLTPLEFARHDDTVEIALPSALIGGRDSARVQVAFLDGAYGVPYAPPSLILGAPADVIGDIALDGVLNDWSAAERLDTSANGVGGYEIYGKATGDHFVIALKAPVEIGAHTTAWINTDADMMSGYKIWGFAGGAEYFVDFGIDGVPVLFVADGGPTLLSLLYFGFNADHTVVEFAIPKALLGDVAEINTLFDVNDAVFLPTRYISDQYKIADASVGAAPVIASNDGGATASLSMKENLTSVTTVTAADADPGALTYAIIGGVDALKFSIDAATGALTFLAAPDFETPADDNGDNIYDVIVSAVDATGRSDQQLLQIAITSAGVAPVISSNGGAAAATISIPENSAAVTTVMATDLDGDAITYAISGGADAARFSINATTGVLAFLTPPDFEVPTDAGANNVYDVVVQASDGALVDTQALAVAVTNVGGATYNGTSGNNTFNGTSEEDTANGANGNDTLNGNAGNDILNGGAGTDVLNGGDGNDVLNGGAGRDVMTGGTGADRFVFSSASDAGNTAAARDVINDFISGVDKIDLSAIDANSGVAGNQNFILLPTAGQAFTAPGQLRYFYQTIGGVEHTIIEGNTTGASGSEFMIDLVGRIPLAASDFIGVDAVTGAQAPVIGSNGGGATASVSIPENSVAVATVMATDLNGDAITYAISGGADAARFSINAITGVLAFLTAPDFEAPTDVGANNVYDVVVQASDGALVDTQALAVAVTNVAGATQNGNNSANTQNGTNEEETLNGAGGNDTINGLGGNDTLNGGNGNDTIRGGNGADTINGDAGNDFLYGEAGNDTLNGGAGNDTMSGGSGADTFIFAATGDIGNGTAVGARDTINDFQVGIDKIDLSAIDANASASGNQAFALLSSAGAAFTAVGQLRFYYQTISGVVHTIVEGNTTGNTTPEFRLDLVGQLSLTSADFLL